MSRHPTVPAPLCSFGLRVAKPERSPCLYGVNRFGHHKKPRCGSRGWDRTHNGEGLQGRGRRVMQVVLTAELQCYYLLGLPYTGILLTLAQSHSICTQLWAVQHWF